NVYDVLQRVKQAIAEQVQPSLPEGVELVVTYDRSQLIEHSVATLRWKLIEESIIVSLVVIVFLFHFRSALVAVLTLPLAVLLALRLQGQEALLLQPLASLTAVSVVVAAYLSFMVGHLLMPLLLRGLIPKEVKVPVIRIVFLLYHRVARVAVLSRYLVVLLAA